MIEEVLGYIHNFFVKEVYKGEFHIVGGNLDVDFLQTNQYFKIVGSIFNDGVFKNTNTTGLTNETFKGEVWALAIPPALLAIVGEIEAWQAKYGSLDSNALSPFNSESFGGYTYTKGSNYSNAEGSSSSNGWQGVFNSKLSQWRKLG